MPDFEMLLPKKTDHVYSHLSDGADLWSHGLHNANIDATQRRAGHLVRRAVLVPALPTAVRDLQAEVAWQRDVVLVALRAAPGQPERVAHVLDRGQTRCARLGQLVDEEKETGEHASTGDAQSRREQDERHAKDRDDRRTLGSAPIGHLFQRLTPLQCGDRWRLDEKTGERNNDVEEVY